MRRLHPLPRPWWHIQSHKTCIRNRGGDSFPWRTASATPVQTRREHAHTLQLYKRRRTVDDDDDPSPRCAAPVSRSQVGALGRARRHGTSLGLSHNLGLLQAFGDRTALELYAHGVDAVPLVGGCHPLPFELRTGVGRLSQDRRTRGTGRQRGEGQLRRSPRRFDVSGARPARCELRSRGSVGIDDIGGGARGREEGGGAAEAPAHTNMAASTAAILLDGAESSGEGRRGFRGSAHPPDTRLISPSEKKKDCLTHHVSQVTPASGAHDLDAPHAPGVVCLRHHRALEALVERRPAATAVVG